MVKEYTCGPTVLAMKVSLSKVQDMAKEAGNQQNQMATFTLAATKTIKKTVMDAMFGQMDAYTKEGLQTT